ncbi:MAG: hypothetical protein VYA30_16650 [Myxococcota bacterium]|nr:hypothetical protein [Myxococcota bacterium]
MATASRLIEILKETAKRLESGATYRWTHQGRCNCGHLAQTITGMSPDDIHQIALTGEGEWRDHAQTFCENSGLAVDDLITQLLNAGLTIEELGHLEWLSDPEVLRWVPSAQLPLDYKRRSDVVAYFKTWAKVLAAEEELRRNPAANVELNGRPYVRRFRAETALDENPVSGRAA